MIDRTNLLTLRELSSEYPIVLMDSSILYGKLSGEERANSIEKKESSIREQGRFFEILKYYIEDGLPCFITPLVLNEYLGGHYPYKKIIKRKGLQQNRKSLDLVRKVRDFEKKEKKLVCNLFEKENRILELNEIEKSLYNSLCGTHYGRACAELGNVNSDSLISGAVLSRIRGATCLTSNNFKMFHLWKDFLNQWRIKKEKFGFAVRLGTNSFKLLENNHNNIQY